MSYKPTSCALLVFAMLAAGARAEDPETPLFSFSGFGTLGVVHSSENQADFVSSNFQPNGAGYTRNWSPTVDSLLAAQVTANFTPRLSAVLQVISEQNYDGNFRPRVEWANMKYEITPDLSLRAGRIVQPAFLVSDYRKVGYALPWVRPPVDVYDMVPISNSDGADATYRMQFGDLTGTVQATYGKADVNFPESKVKGKHLWSLSATATQGAATAHLTYLRTRLTIEGVFQPLFDGLRQFGPEGVALADKYEPTNTPFTFVGFGGIYDPGGWFAMGEWGHANSHAVIGSRTAWYTSGGYRFGAFTPYLTYARTKSDSNSSDPGLDLSALPPFLAGAAAGLNAGLNAILASVPVQNTISVGARWDFAKSADLKLQFDRVNLGAGSSGTLINVQPRFQPGGRFSVVSATIDFVF